MTITETRPEPAAAQTASAATAPAPGNWLTTGDHKRLGLLYIAGGLVATLVGTVLAAAYLAPGSAELPYVWTASGSRLTSGAITGVLIIGLPALWLGAMTAIIPLQLGATRIALPRLQSLSVWTFFAGSVLTALGYTVGRPSGVSLGSILPQASTGSPTNTATELLLAGLALVGVATLLGAIGVATTILNQRADAVTLSRMPAFAWSGLATSLALIISTPVFLGGLALLWVDLHYGGSFFAVDAVAGIRVWQHHLWIFGRPELFLVVAPALGALSDVVTTAAGRPLLAFPAVRGAAVAAALWSLIAWATPFSALESPVLPTPTVGTALFILPVAIVVLAWLGSLVLGSPSATPGSLHAAAFLVVALVGAAMTLVAALVGIDGSLAAEAFANGQLWLVVAAALLGVTGALTHWAPKLSGKVVPFAASAGQALVLVLGGILVALPGWVSGLGSDSSPTVVGAAGAALLALGVALSIPALVGRGQADPDPTGRGLTLEWATASPPAMHNFDSVPAVGSAHPLASDSEERA
ncbi:MAG: cbb3-type cytochrome c oxidase subunit I [Acidimicrobiales bacterium]